MTGEKKPNVRKEVKKTKVVDKTLSLSQSINEIKVGLKPHQKPVSNFLRENNISILLAEAGCAKDFIQMYRALEGLKEGEFKRIIITKPIVELGKSIGFLPGLDEKLQPYERSFYESISKILGRENINNVKSKIQFEHIGFLRGNTFPEHSVIILSEVQNMTLHEIISYVTRVPESSKLFINGDGNQSDLGNRSGLKDFLKIIKGIRGIGVLELDPEVHQMRNPMITALNRNYVKFLNNKVA